MDSDAGAIRMPSAALNPDPLALLVREHASLERLFARHQEALVNRSWARAARLLESYGRHLQRHIAIEEQLLLPHCQMTGAGLRWKAGVYSAEHRRVELLLGNNRERLAHARRRGMTATALVALLDQEKTLKHLVGHHHEREETALFAELRQVLSGEVRKQLLRALSDRPSACC